VKEAKKLRTIELLECEAKFAAVREGLGKQASPPSVDDADAPCRPSSIGACNAASAPRTINPQTKPALRQFTPQSVPNVLTTDKK